MDAANQTLKAATAPATPRADAGARTAADIVAASLADLHRALADYSDPLPASGPLDDVLAVAAGFIAQWGEIAPTLEMKVSYLNQGGAGRHIAEAKVVKRGRQINFLEATLMREDGKVIATSTATIMIAPMKKK